MVVEVDVSGAHGELPDREQDDANGQSGKDLRRSARQVADATAVVMSAEQALLVARVDDLAQETDAAIRRLKGAELDLAAACERFDQAAIAVAIEQVMHLRIDLERISTTNLIAMNAVIESALDNFDVALANEQAAAEPTADERLEPDPGPN
jgi:hypothetical protein